MKKIAVLFPGYGSQYVGMGKDLYDDSRIMQEFFEEAYTCQNLNFVKLCFASSDQELGQLSNAYQSIFLLNGALYGLLLELGIKPDILAGYNIGHFSALFASGSITFPDGLYLLNKYATFYQTFLESADVKMIEVFGLSETELESLISKFVKSEDPVYLSVIKNKETFLLSGKTESVDNLESLLLKIEGVKISKAPLEIGLYSPLMEDVANQLKLYLEKVDFKDAHLPVLTSGLKEPLVLGSEIKFNLIDSLVRTYDLDFILSSLKDYDVIIEVGPKNKLTEIVKKYFPEKEVLSFGTKLDFEAVKALLDSAKDLPENEKEDNF